MQSKSGRRWTIGASMMLIALLAVLLAMYAQMAKLPDPYPERSAWQALSERRIKKNKNKVVKAQKSVPQGVADVPSTTEELPR